MTKRKQKPLKERLALLKKAIINEDHKKLTPLQFAMWTRLARRNLGKPKPYSNVFSEVGVSNATGRKTLRALFKKNLLCKDSQRHLTFKGVIKEIRAAIGTPSLIRPIFGSPKEKEMFRALESIIKKENYELAIYPGVSIRDIIDIDTLRDHDPTFYLNYFLMCNLDAVVFDMEGMPMMAFEYQGGYHRSNKDAKKKDALKRKILKLAEIPLVEINHRRLKTLCQNISKQQQQNPTNLHQSTHNALLDPKKKLLKQQKLPGFLVDLQKETKK